MLRPSCAAAARRAAGRLACPLTVALLVALGPLHPAGGQTPAPQASPQDFGLVISRQGPVRQGEGRRVVVHTAPGEDKVALVHVDVGDRRLVILPNGRMASFAISETKAT